MLARANPLELVQTQEKYLRQKRGGKGKTASVKGRGGLWSGISSPRAAHRCSIPILIPFLSAFWPPWPGQGSGSASWSCPGLLRRHRPCFVPSGLAPPSPALVLQTTWPSTPPGCDTSPAPTTEPELGCVPGSGCSQKEQMGWVGRERPSRRNVPEGIQRKGRG